MNSLLKAMGVSAVALVLAAGASRAQTSNEPVRLTAWAVNMGTMATGANSVVQIQIDRWSPDADRDRFITTLMEKGPGAMLRELQKSPRMGFIRLPNTLAHDLRFARQVPLEDGGRRIVIATDRRMGFWEVRNRPRTYDYPFTLIEIHLDRDGAGEGKLALFTKITHNKKDNLLEIENYGSEPVRLQNVKAEPVKR